uniref:protein FAM204A-like isoform X2 n=1 Tax=Styela clava TaxID=7725 RepID=UPI00193A8B20|nr:protein FAM204A-like isoform X2 [Styela clava]
MFKDLEEIDSSDSDSSIIEDKDTSSKSLPGTLTARVLKLREQLNKEEGLEKLIDQVYVERETSSSGVKLIESSSSTSTFSHSEGDLKNQQLVLKKKLNQCLRQGNVTEADKLSDQLSQTELQLREIKAVVARDYLKRKCAKEEDKARRKKKKLAWGFETKKKWETKSNM